MTENDQQEADEVLREVSTADGVNIIFFADGSIAIGRSRSDAEKAVWLSSTDTRQLHGALDKFNEGGPEAPDVDDVPAYHMRCLSCGWSDRQAPVTLMRCPDCGNPTVTGDNVSI